MLNYYRTIFIVLFFLVLPINSSTRCWKIICVFYFICVLFYLCVRSVFKIYLVAILVNFNRGEIMIIFSREKQEFWHQGYKIKISWFRTWCIRWISAGWRSVILTYIENRLVSQLYYRFCDFLYHFFQNFIIKEIFDPTLVIWLTCLF